MLRTKIITRPTTTEVQLLEALPKDFHGHVTFDLDRPNIQVCVIHHWTYINPKQVYENLNGRLIRESEETLFDHREADVRIFMRVWGASPQKIETSCGDVTQ